MILEETSKKETEAISQNESVKFDFLAQKDSACHCKIENKNTNAQLPELKLISESKEQIGNSNSANKAIAKAEKQWADYLKTGNKLSPQDAENAFKLESAIIKGDAQTIQKVVEQYKDNLPGLKAIADVSQNQLQGLNSQLEIDVPDNKKAMLLVHQHLNEGEDGQALKVYGRPYDTGNGGKPTPLIEMSSLFKICGGEQFETYGSYVKQDVPQFMKDLSKQVSSDINWTR
jgi:hypothetical protein